MNYRSEIDRLYLLEYGDRLEVCARFLGVGGGGILLFAYSGSALGVIWAVGFLCAHCCFFLYLRTCGTQIPARAVTVAQLIFLVVIVSFLWMPSWMLVQEDRPLSLVGAALIGCLLVYLVQRGETSLFVLQGQIVVIVCATVAMLVYLLPQIEDQIAIAAVLISWVALLGYFAQSILTARKRILSEKSAMLQAAQAQKLSAIGQLAGGVAHDFNNILTAISGNLELHENLEDPAEREEVIREARSATARAAKTVRQLLIYARKSPFDLSLMQANRPLDDLQALLEHLVPAKIRVSIYPLSPPEEVRIDENQLVTALMNLVVNAVDAMPEGGLIEICATRTHFSRSHALMVGKPLSPGSYVVYEVADTGGGIPARILPQVVEPFFTSKEAGKGTGLGLSMVSSIADNMGGGLEITSSPDGTTVRLYVPCLPRRADIHAG